MAKSSRNQLFFLPGIDVAIDPIMRMRLHLLVVSAIFSQSAHATPVLFDSYQSELERIKDRDTYIFFQEFDDDSFVTGFFRGKDHDGDGILESFRICRTTFCGRPDHIALSRNNGPTQTVSDLPDELNDVDWSLGDQIFADEITDFALFFTAPSRGVQFLISGLDALTSDPVDDGDAYNALYYRIGSFQIPFVADDCFTFQDVVDARCAGMLVARRQVTDVAIRELADGAPHISINHLRTGFKFANGGFNVGAAVQRIPREGDSLMRVVEIPEPPTIALFTLGLFGIRWSSRLAARKC